jgi:hypothetical protein
MGGAWKALACWLVLLAVAAERGRLAAAPPDTRARLEGVAEKLEFFPVHAFTANATDLGFVPRDMAEAYRRQVEKMADPGDEVKTLTDLLRHDSPKVRTLAAAALFARLDPKILPDLVPLARDPAETFPTPRLTAVPFGSGSKPAMDRQTVGQVVTSMLQEYLIPAGYHYGLDGVPGHPGFEDYWARRKDRDHCAGWFEVQLRWASGGTLPTRKVHVPAVRDVRRRIDRLPEEDRVFTLLWLRDGPGGDVLASEDDLIAACQHLGPAPLVKLLQRQIPSDDPDLQPRPSNNSQYARMQMFVLQHASQVLRPEDADAVLACEASERDYLKHGISDPLLTPEWFIATVELQPAKAKEILTPAWDRAQGLDRYTPDYRARLVSTWWRRVNDADPAFVVKWFYEEKPERGRFPNCRALFLREFGPTPGPRDRKLLAALVADRHFDALDWQSLDQMIQLVNSWEKRPVVSPEELRSVQHPLGMGHFDWEQDRARADYPKETKEVLATFARWRQAVRAHLQQP